MIPDTNTHEYATKGQANLNTVLSILGTLGFVNGGGCGNGLGGLLGGGCNVNRELAAKDAEIARLNTDVKLRDSQVYTDQKIANTVEYINNRVSCIEAQLGEQRAYNAANNATLGCIKGQIEQLFSVTTFGVRNDKLVPGVPPVYLTHTAPTATTTTAG